MTGAGQPGTRFPQPLAALSFPGARPGALSPAFPLESPAGCLAHLDSWGTAPGCAWNLRPGPDRPHRPRGLSPLAAALEERRELAGAVAWLMRWEAGVKSACELLRDAGLPPGIALKGTTARYRHYPAPHLRTSSDVDILLPGRAVPEAVAALERGGFEVCVTDPARRHTARFGHQVMLRKERTIVELHRSVDYHVRKQLSYEALSAEATPLTELHNWLLGTAPADSLLVEAAHALKHGLLVPLRNIVDVQMALSAQGLDLDRLSGLANASGLQRVLALLVLQAGSLSMCWTPVHSSLVAPLPRGTELVFDPWRLGGNALPDGRRRKLLAHLVLTPGLAQSRDLIGRFLARRLKDLTSR